MIYVVSWFCFESSHVEIQQSPWSSCQNTFASLLQIRYMERGRGELHLCPSLPDQEGPDQGTQVRLPREVVRRRREAEEAKVIAAWEDGLDSRSGLESLPSSSSLSCS